MPGRRPGHAMRAAGVRGGNVQQPRGGIPDARDEREDVAYQPAGHGCESCVGDCHGDRAHGVHTEGDHA